MNDIHQIKNVLISVYDKSNLVTFARALVKKNINLYSTGGTTEVLKKSGIQVQNLSTITNFPEIMNGRVKTLHPKIFAGILRQPHIDQEVILRDNIVPFDMIVVNFYPFEKMLQNKQYNINKLIEYIDVGGPSIVRAAIKNYHHVVTITNISDYCNLIKHLERNTITTKKKFNLAIKALTYITTYDTIILDYFKEYAKKNNNCIEHFPELISLNYTKKQKLVYGENKHQRATFYVKKPLIKGSISSSVQQQGKTLSFNNILDSDIALECVKEFKDPTCVIVKHGNPCGVSTKTSILEAYKTAYQTDPTSSFGGVIAFNHPLDKITASTIINNQFVEVIITPPYNSTINTIFQKKPNIRILVVENINNFSNELNFKHVNGGLLLQESDKKINNNIQWKVVSLRKPTNAEIQDAIFCWKVAKFVKSNAIVYSKNNQTVAIGAGQMSRIDSTTLANMKLLQHQKNITKITLASDAFLPFSDNVKEAVKSGISCIIQPGGSIRDSEVIKVANTHNVAMIFTYVRHFKH